MNRRNKNVSPAKGFSLIELLVAMAIGLVVTLAITTVLISSESAKRTHASVNDIDQTGTFIAFTLDRAIRSAGSGYSQNWKSVYGCLLDAKQNSVQALPMPNTIASPSAFENVRSTTLPGRLAPVIIAKNLANVGARIGGDILMVMSGTGGVSEVSQPVTPGSVSSAGLQLQSGYGYQTNDLILLSDPGVPSCMVEQVGVRASTDASANLPLAAGTGSGPSYYTAVGASSQLSQFGATTMAVQLGNVANMPQFQLYGVGPNNTLNSMDLLTPVSAGSSPDVPIADGVVELRALYGLDTNPPTGVIDQWVDPGVAPYTATTLTLPASQSTLRQVIAIRVGMILRTSLPEQAPIKGATNATTGFGTQPLDVNLFGDLSTKTGASLKYTRTYAAGTSDLNYRYRTIETTIPLRNVLLAPPV